jgi:hypothetical protein
MPNYFYFLLALVSVTGFLLIGVIARINRRRKNSRRIRFPSVRLSKTT